MSAEFVPLANLRTELTAAVVSYDIAGVSGFAIRDMPHLEACPPTSATGYSIVQPRRSGLRSAPSPIGGGPMTSPANLLANMAATLSPPPTGRSSPIVSLRRSTCSINPKPSVRSRPVSGRSNPRRASHLARWRRLIGDFCRRRSALSAPVRWIWSRYARRTRLFHWADDHFKLSERAWIAAAWSAQVAGQATTAAGSLDLVNFERRQARLQFGVSF